VLAIDCLVPLFSGDLYLSYLIVVVESFMWCMSFRNRIFLCCYSYFPPSNAFCVDLFDFTESFSMAFLDSMDHAYFLFFE